VVEGSAPVTDDRVRRPSLALLALEGPRAVGELGLLAGFQPLLRTAPRGDGHPVLVLPGLLADDRSTAPLRHFLRRLGYHVHGWSLGRNVPSERVRAGLAARIEELVARHGSRRISLVGWSLGGIYARQIALVVPASVRQVITLGSPFADTPGEESHPGAMLRLLLGDRPSPQLEQGPLPVPSTAIFTRTDGIVPWRASGARRARVPRASRWSRATAAWATTQRCCGRWPIGWRSPRSGGRRSARRRRGPCSIPPEIRSDP
jgi:pimeloyl-ACP methyl ester carboxylesterase